MVPLRHELRADDDVYLALGDLPQIDPASSSDAKAAGGGTRTGRTSAKTRNRGASGSRGKKGRQTGSR